MSTCVTARVAVQVFDAAGARFPAGHDTADRPGSGSVTATADSVTLPVLVTKNQ